MLAPFCVTEQIHPMSIDSISPARSAAGPPALTAAPRSSPHRGISEGRLAVYALGIVTVISMLTVFAVLSH